MATVVQRRLEELAQGLLRPLVLGGPVRLVPPIGAELALTIGQGRRIVDDELRSSLDVARVRRVRLVAPLDVLPELSPGEWALVAALNDLLQVTNHELSGPLTRGRHAALCASLDRLFEALAPPKTVMEVLARHATLARALEIQRTDTLVRSWAGNIQYRGQQPERSMTFWPQLRRVSIEPRKVPVASMMDGLSALPEATFTTLLTKFLALTPLTDMATLARPSPAFAWTASTLRLVSFPAGRSLALRALSRIPAQPAIAALRTATAAIPPGSSAYALADSLCTDLLERADART